MAQIVFICLTKEPPSTIPLSDAVRPLSPEYQSSLLSLLDPNSAVHLPATIYGVVLDGKIVATLTVTADFKSYSQYIYNVCTGEKYRRQGFMKELFTVVIEHIRKPEETNQVFYLHVAPDNASAYKLYTSLGFKKVGETDEKHDILKLE